MGPSSDFMTWPLCVSVLCSSAVDARGQLDPMVVLFLRGGSYFI
jgi:hypothetical protein